MSEVIDGPADALRQDLGRPPRRPETADTPAVLYVDLHLVHEVTSPQAFAGAARARPQGAPARPHRGHHGPLHAHDAAGANGRFRVADAQAAAQVAHARGELQRLRHPALRAGQRAAGHRPRHRSGAGPDPAGHDHRLRRQPHQHPRRVRRAGLRHRHQRSRARARHPVPAAARSPRPSRSRSTAGCQPGVTAKDIILALIAKIGVGGGTGHVFEYRGAAIRALSHGRAHDRLQHVDRRRGARRHDRARRHDLRVSGRPAHRRRRARRGTRPSPRGGRLPTDEGATYDRDGRARRRRRCEPMITYGTNPGHGHRQSPAPSPIPTRRPGPSIARQGAALHGPRAGQAAARPADRRGLHRQLHQLAHLAICAPPPACFDGPQGGRRACACWSCPARSRSSSRPRPKGSTGSSARPAPSGASRAARMCIAMNGDQLEPGQYAVSTSNRNFEGRQGTGGRTFLASPLTAAAAAVDRPRHRRPGAARDDENPSGRSRSRTVVLPRDNIDTDQIIPARFLKATTKDGPRRRRSSPTGATTPTGSPRPDFVLNRPEAEGAQVLVAGDNFGCGSLARARPWALVRLRLPGRGQPPRSPTSSATTRSRTACCRCWSDAETHARLLAAPGAEVDDRPRGAGRSRSPTAPRVAFPIEPFARYCLLERHRRAGVPARAGGGHRRLRGRPRRARASPREARLMNASESRSSEETASAPRSRAAAVRPRSLRAGPSPRRR